MCFCSYAGELDGTHKPLLDPQSIRFFCYFPRPPGNPLYAISRCRLAASVLCLTCKSGEIGLKHVWIISEKKMRYIALLRGINVGGHTVKMEQLRQLFAGLGLENVRSYINSGNVFFETLEADSQEVSQRIEYHLGDALGFEVPVFLRTPGEIQAILDQDPFQSVELTPDKRFCVIFTGTPLDNYMPLPVHSTKNDMDIIAVNRYEAFVVWHILNGRPPSGRFPPEQLPARNTSRFYHTLGKILQAANAS